MGIHEECGVIGVFAPGPADVASMVFGGLFALQHRGQEGCGVVVNDDGVFASHKDLGLVGEVLAPEVLARLPRGSMAVGHVRYGTTGARVRANCQPIEVNHRKGRMALAHNGNLSNADELRCALELAGAIFHTTSDTETIAYLVTRERLRCPSIEDALSAAMNEIAGAYSLVLMSPQKLICARDPHGFRPLCYGVTDEGVYVVASESCALAAVGARFLRDVDPGEIVVFTAEGPQARREHCQSAPRASCVFEYIYFARPDSVVDGVSVHAARLRAGAILAEEHPVDADVVVGVPDSGLDAALGYARASGIPWGMGLVRNRYVGRTFISPGQSARLDKVRLKLAAMGECVRGRRVVLVDDSIVRGTTARRIVALLREAGAAEVHLRISAPPFLHPCYYGTDVDSEEHLIACRCSVPEIARELGADSLGYLPAERLGELVGGACVCAACFDGRYPTAVPACAPKNRFERKLSEGE